MGFGRTVRKLREERGLTIAAFAKKVGISPTYLAPIEREVFPPPVEGKIVKIAKALDRDPDEMLAQADKVSTDLQRIIKKRPRQTARLLRAAGKLSASQLDKLVDQVDGKLARRR